MKHTPSFVAYLILAILALLLAGGVLAYLSNLGTEPHTVTLQADTHRGTVAMYFGMGGGPMAVETYPDGTRCTQVEPEPFMFDNGADVIPFYRLNCNGRIGYVNALRIKRR